MQTSKTGTQTTNIIEMPDQVVRKGSPPKVHPAFQSNPKIMQMIEENGGEVPHFDVPGTIRIRDRY